ncbi:colorectal mutant cancer protein-like [Hyla sarda]|uniref:colorectal mutant cancer protein-like n=1 Tax=Hyla sarda TaxID=327740 RepID=UPI0024C30DDB|nr:colorectal mutant cancer protein-like [Hyla sarda]XP_056374076.1 colorectal mutant cancer protein-like [Hyla sarda]XP_056374077.1 colorectal mutant cancer protein-like [Hyla sarda]XP_056374078.1 colorectal mutant cancer protein-like [Hyla sarda]
MEESFHSENESQSSLLDPGNTAYQNDLFLQLQEVISSLETCVFSWKNPPGNRSREESVASPNDLCSNEKPEIVHGLNQISDDDANVLQSEITRFQENNAALRVKLRLTDKELNSSTATLNIFKEEKEKLQTKVKNLQDILRDKGLSTATASPPGSPLLEELNSFTSEHYPVLSEPKSHQAPISAVRSVIQYLQSLPGCQTSVSCPSEIHPSNIESEMKWLKWHLDRLKQMNEQLSATLEECKTDSEKLSMHLGKLESTCTALRLALQSSERCLKTYSVLLALAEAKQEIMLGQVSAGDVLKSGWRLLPKELEIKTKLFLMEVKKIFRKKGKSSDSETKKMDGQKVNSLYAPWLNEEEEQMLKDYIQSLKWDLSSITMSDHFNAGTSHAKKVTQCAEMIKAKVDDAIKDSPEASPCLSEKPARAQIMQDLMYTKKKLSELKASLQLLQTEKRALELQSLTQQEQEKAYMLVQEHLQIEQNEWIKEASGKNKTNKQKHQDVDRDCLGQSENSTSSTSMQRLTDSLKRSNEMKGRIEGLISEVEQLSCKVCAENTKTAQMIKDFFKAHRNLFMTYQNACRKYQEQQHKLESQADLMSQQQQRQLQKLGQNIQNLQKKKIQKDAGETSL